MRNPFRKLTKEERKEAWEKKLIKTQVVVSHIQSIDHNPIRLIDIVTRKLERKLKRETFRDMMIRLGGAQ